MTKRVVYTLEEAAEELARLEDEAKALSRRLTPNQVKRRDRENRVLETRGWLAKTFTRKRHGHLIVSCQRCGKEFLRQEAGKPPKFCSNRCYDAHYKELNRPRKTTRPKARPPGTGSVCVKKRKDGGLTFFAAFKKADPSQPSGFWRKKILIGHDVDGWTIELAQRELDIIKAELDSGQLIKTTSRAEFRPRRQSRKLPA